MTGRPWPTLGLAMAGKPQSTCKAGHPKGPGRCVTCRRKSDSARNPGRCHRVRGLVGGERRERYNERRRASAKRVTNRKILAELEASRRHRGTLMEFLRRKAA